MKSSIILMVAMLALAPLAASADPVIVQVTYLGQGQFQYDSKAYSYNDLVTAIQSDYAGKHFDGVLVDMGSVASQLDKVKVCPLRQSLLAPVEMFITVNGEKREMFCS